MADTTLSKKLAARPPAGAFTPIRGHVMDENKTRLRHVALELGRHGLPRDRDGRRAAWP